LKLSGDLKYMRRDRYLVVEELSPLSSRDLRYFCLGFEFDFHRDSEAIRDILHRMDILIEEKRVQRNSAKNIQN
jgi:hypothetical protein